ncbi:hypothetical protein GCM10027446_13790 [Angustibacter peucedani]
MNVRRSAAGLTLGLALVVSGASAAFADATYPPSTPSPTSSVAHVSSPTVLDTDAEVSPSADALPRTGTDVLEWSIAGLGLVAAGAALVVVTRRRGVRA